MCQEEISPESAGHIDTLWSVLMSLHYLISHQSSDTMDVNIIPIFISLSMLKLVALAQTLEDRSLKELPKEACDLMLVSHSGTNIGGKTIFAQHMLHF